MKPISETDIRARIKRDNLWWTSPDAILEAAYPRRVYFKAFRELALNARVRRAAVLLGPRRVGKTVMLKQLVSEAICGGYDPKSILYASIDAPVYSGISLEQFLALFEEQTTKLRLVIFDEIQYLKDWETHLKDLVDSYPEIKFVASGSAAAALRLKSRESGAGRFSEFMLPPLTFYEFLQFQNNLDDHLIEIEEAGKYQAKDINALNKAFVDYLNYGGYPEAVLNPAIRQNPDQFIRNDIIDKVLLKDLPSLYGIQEIQDLNKLFSFLAYNAGNEASLDNISKQSGLAKPTIKKYIEYLESAFLIIKLSTVDENCRSMQRERNFKIYLNNPSMRAALFTPVKESDGEKIGHLAESAVFSQWQHSQNFRELRYARWRGGEGEVDVVYLDPRTAKALWIGEVKWSDRIKDNLARETKSMLYLKRRHKGIESAFITTKTYTAEHAMLDDLPLTITPTALYCYTVGRNITSKPLGMRRPRRDLDDLDD